MKSITVHHYDAFSTVPGKGNPAGVIIDADHLSEDDMQRIAEKVGFNETVFVLPSDQANLRLRYFTPGHEMNLCGHATIGSLFALVSRGLLQNIGSIQIETNVGILPVHFETDDGKFMITMKQDTPKFKAFEGDVAKLAASMGLKIDDIDSSKPIVYGSTGTWTILIPIKELSRFQDMKPNNSLFPDILLENPKSSIHPFCLEAYDKDAFMHARHFSSPYSGTIEDAVTGTASGVMGAYYLTYIDQKLDSFECVVEQGQEIEKDGRVSVKVLRTKESSMDVYVSGTAVYVRDLEIQYA